MNGRTPAVPDDFGPPVRAADMESVAGLVRAAWQTAFPEGSTFLERSWFADRRYDLLVAVSWPVRGRKSLDESAGHYVRVRPVAPP